jgi:chemotaxis protein CheX
MRVEYINPFVEAAYNVLSEVLAIEITRGELYLKSTSTSVLGVAAIVGLAGDVEGRVLFDMTMNTALAVSNKMMESMGMDEVTEFNDMAKATITELANMITGQAVTKLHNLGFSFDLTPPAILTGENMEISDQKVEALIVPMEMEVGKIEINVAVRERA